MNVKLLVIAPHYHTFVKDSVEAQSRYFDKINVLVPHSYLTEIASYLPLSWFRRLERFSKKRLIDLTDIPKNVRVHVLSTLRLIRFLRNVRLGDQLFNLFKKHIEKHNITFDLILAHFTWPSGHVGARLKEEHGTPLIVVAHGFDIYDLPFRNEQWERKIRHVLASADHVITVSKKNLSLIKRLNVKTPVTVVSNGFRSDLFQPRDQRECRKILKLPLDRKVILTVGNLVEVKGHKYLIDAVARVVKHGKDVLCVIIGDGNLEKKLKRQVKSLGLEKHVKLVGHRPHEMIPLWMNAADLFVLPSLNESFGIVQVEAMAVGTPVVATVNDGSKQVITSEDCGLLCPPKDATCLAEKILMALEKDWNKKKIIQHARQFTWETVAQKITHVCHDVMAKKR